LAECKGCGGDIQSEPTESSRSATSARVGFWPQALRRSPRLALGTRPFPLLSNNAKASRYWSVDEGCKQQLARLEKTTGTEESTGIQNSYRAEGRGAVYHVSYSCEVAEQESVWSKLFFALLRVE
jgi:hypothetical protein